VVDTYVRPADPAPSDLHNLAKGLENFSRDIRGMFAARDQRDEEAARIRGEAQFFQDNQVGYAEAVKRGKIPAYNSRPFMESYKEAEGRVIGARLASKMQLEYQTWDGRNSQDPANFDAFMATFLKKNLTNTDPAVLKGAMPYIYQSVNNNYNQRTQDAADAAYNGGLNANIAVSAMAIDSHSDQGLTSGKGTDYDAVWNELIQNRGTALTSGIRTLDYDQKLVDVIAAKALEERDPALLALLDRSLPGSDTPISASPYGRDVKAKTINAMETVYSQHENAAYTAQQRKEKAMKDELTGFAIKAIMEDPNTVLPENFWAAFEKVEPEARVKVQEWRNAAMNGQEEDGEAVADLTYRVLVGGENAMDIINEGTENGTIRSTATLQKLYQMGQEDPVWQKTQAYKLGLDAIKQMAGMGNALGPNGSFAFDPTYLPPAATAAALDFELSLRAWALTKEGKEAIATGNMAAISSETARVQKVITDSFTLSVVGPATYIQPPEVTDELEEAGFESNPLAPSQRGINQAAERDRRMKAARLQADETRRAASEAAAFKAAKEDLAKDWTSGQVPDLNALPQEEQTFIREEADKRGIDPQMFLQETYNQVEQIINEVNAGAAIEQGLEDIVNGGGDERPPSGDQSDATNPAGASSVIERGGDIPMGRSGGVAEAADFVPPKTNTADLLPEVLSKYGNRRLPASIRLNNMGGISITGSQGNIPNTWAARQAGFVGVVARPANEGGWYAQYATPEDGIRAASNLLIRYGEDGVDTPTEIARKWAVGSRAQYAATTTRYLRDAGYDVSADSPLNLNDPGVRLAILRAKSAHESGFGRPIYRDALYERAVMPAQSDDYRVASNE